MRARCLSALSLYNLIVSASPHARIRAGDATASREFTSYAPYSIPTSITAPPPPVVDLLANASTPDRHHFHTTQRQHPHGTAHGPADRPTHPPTHHISPIPRPAQTLEPGDIQPHHADGGLSSSHAHKGLNIARTFFEVLGGVAGILVLIAIARCFYVYKKTPRGRSPPPEIGEVDRRLAMLRNPWRPIDIPQPPPPYQPAPDYDAAVHTPSPHPPSPRPPPPL